jgi:hypothetical protein
LLVDISKNDTLSARCEGPGQCEKVKVRLHGIDVPEHKQSFGENHSVSVLGWFWPSWHFSEGSRTAPHQDRPALATNLLQCMSCAFQEVALLHPVPA